jgi:nitrate/TMAO reductase-like tetraheme cytochrome c subunit
MRNAMLCCAFASALLSHTAFLSQNAVAGSSESGQTQTVHAQPRLRLAQNTGAAGKTGTVVGSEQKLSAGAEAAVHGEMSVLTAAAKAEKGKEAPIPAVDEETLSLYPTAAQCGGCHKQIYEEWSSSNHAYASISPMFHAFEQKFQQLTQGTVGTFCVRCHQQVGTQLGENRETPLWATSQISREGVTCVTCHRVKEQYGKVNGERRVEPGKIFEPVYGSGENSVIKDVLANKDTYSVKTSKDGRGMDIHNGMMTNPQITKSEFCVSCHQVAVNLGINLEIVWDQYRNSPARKAGVTCQDCHMGKVPGKPEGYATAPSAVVGGKEINPGRKHANHGFIGPGYSVAHPGIFPHNTKAQAFSIKEWLQFDWRAGWGTNEFEDKVAHGKIKVDFPKRWADALDREDGRQFIEENLAKLDERYELRRQVMENGTKVDGPYIGGDPKVGRDLAFLYKITNLNSGHNLPSGSLGAQPQLWVNVALIDPDGQNVWESGYVDSNGDMADLHSLDVAAGRIKTDEQLVHFQTKFLTTNVKGTDREMYLPVNFDIDPLPHLRPPQIPTTVLNHPPLVRMENHSLPPLGEEQAKYQVPGNLIKKPGKYRLAFRLRSRAEPIYFMRFVGAAKEMERRMNERMLSFKASTVELEVRP